MQSYFLIWELGEMLVTLTKVAKKSLLYAEREYK